MKPSIKEQLSTLNFNFGAYGPMPIADDVLLFKNQPIFKKYQDLYYIRQNLKTLNDYLKQNKGETLNDWLKQYNQTLSVNITGQVGKYNNNHGGISGLFYNLQNMYDIEEANYDAMESQLSVGDISVRNDLNKMLGQRVAKRRNRSTMRKKLVNNLKTNNLGYIVVDIESEAPAQNAAGPQPNNTEKTEVNSTPAPENKEAETTNTNKPAQPNNITQVKRKNIGIKIAGTILFVTLASIIISAGTQKND